MEKEKVITLIDAFKDFKEEKNIDRPVMMQVLKDVFLTQIAKTYGSSDNFDVIVNVDKGTCEIYQNFDVVEEVENPNSQITLKGIEEDGGDAADYEIGDQYSKQLPLAAFGRRGFPNTLQSSVIHVPGDHVLDLLRLHHAHMAVNQLAVLVKLDGGHRLDMILGGQLGVVCGVELDDIQKGNLGVQVLENTGKELAGHAGGAVKIDDHKTVVDKVFKIFAVGLLDHRGASCCVSWGWVIPRRAAGFCPGTAGLRGCARPPRHGQRTG